MEKKIEDIAKEVTLAVQVASFSSKEEAVKFKESIKGFKAEVEEVDKYFVVRVKNIKDEKELLVVQKQLKIAGYDTVLIK